MTPLTCQEIEGGLSLIGSPFSLGAPPNLSRRVIVSENLFFSWLRTGMKNRNG